jgi:hypothetical protein
VKRRSRLGRIRGRLENPVGTTKLAFLRQWTKFENLASGYQEPGEY